MEESNDHIKKTILVAEDVESNFLLLKALLAKTYNLLHAYNGSEAVEMFDNNQPDLILMDVKMPVMDGLEATRIIRQKSTEIPIIALTAFAFDQDRIRVMEAGSKPLSPPLLKETIIKYLK